MTTLLFISIGLNVLLIVVMLVRTKHSFNTIKLARRSQPQPWTDKTFGKLIFEKPKKK